MKKLFSVLTFIFCQNSLANPLAEMSTVDSAKAVIAINDWIEGPRAEVNIFLQFFVRNEWEKALYQWKAATNSQYRRSDKGKAIYGYLLFKNNLKISGLENLLEANPTSLPPKLIELWKAEVSNAENSWVYVNADWSSGWSNVFGLPAEIKVKAKKLRGESFDKEVYSLSQKVKAGTWEKAWLDWQLVLNRALSDKAGEASKILKGLMSAPNNPISADNMNITAARLLYQEGYLDAAQDFYEKVPKSSDFWFEAQEEIGWIYIRQGRPQDTLAVTQTLMPDTFAKQVGPEALFLRSLALLKVCDYPEVVRVVEIFKERFKTRVQNLNKVVKNSDLPEINSFMDKSVQEELKFENLSSGAADLMPRYSTRDEVLKFLVKAQSLLAEESKLADQIYYRSITGGTDKVGLEGRIKEFQQEIQTRSRKVRGLAMTRIQELASQELAEIKTMLDKFHIVEAELIQQISASEKIIQASSQKIEKKEGSTVKSSRDGMKYPFEEEEIWFDELANYKVDIKKGCQAKR